MIALNNLKYNIKKNPAMPKSKQHNGIKSRPADRREGIIRLVNSGFRPDF